MSLGDRLAEFMKVYSVVIVMALSYSGIVELSPERGHAPAEIIIWVLLVAVGVYGILTFIIIEGLEF